MGVTWGEIIDGFNQNMGTQRRRFDIIIEKVNALQGETERLKAELAAVTVQRDGLDDDLSAEMTNHNKTLAELAVLKLAPRFDVPHGCPPNTTGTPIPPANVSTCMVPEPYIAIGVGEPVPAYMRELIGEENIDADGRLKAPEPKLQDKLDKTMELNQEFLDLEPKDGRQ